MTKATDKGKSLTGTLFTVSEGESMTMVTGNMADQHATGAVAKNGHSYLQIKGT